MEKNKKYVVSYWQQNTLDSARLREMSGFLYTCNFREIAIFPWLCPIELIGKGLSKVTDFDPQGSQVHYSFT